MAGATYDNMLKNLDPFFPLEKQSYTARYNGFKKKYNLAKKYIIACCAITIANITINDGSVPNKFVIDAALFPLLLDLVCEPSSSVLDGVCAQARWIQSFWQPEAPERFTPNEILTALNRKYETGIQMQDVLAATANPQDPQAVKDALVEIWQDLENENSLWNSDNWNLDYLASRLGF